MSEVEVVHAHVRMWSFLRASEFLRRHAATGGMHCLAGLLACTRTGWAVCDQSLSEASSKEALKEEWSKERESALLQEEMKMRLFGP